MCRAFLILALFVCALLISGVSFYLGGRYSSAAILAYQIPYEAGAKVVSLRCLRKGRPDDARIFLERELLGQVVALDVIVHKKPMSSTNVTFAKETEDRALVYFHVYPPTQTLGQAGEELREGLARDTLTRSLANDPVIKAAQDRNLAIDRRFSELLEGFDPTKLEVNKTFYQKLMREKRMP